MKVLLINGSPNPKGCIAAAQQIAAEELSAAGIESETVMVGNKDVRGCIACSRCRELGRCVFNDIVNEVNAKLEKADGLVVGSPVYYSSPNGTLISFLDRLFYSAQYDMHMKVGAGVVSARRGGTTASFDVLNKYFGISEMPVAGSTYWNIAHGRRPGEVALDEEGLRTMRNLGRNLAWMLKCFEAGEKAGVAKPETEQGPATNFIR